MKLFGIKLKYFFSPKAWMSWLRGQIIGSDLKQEYVEQVMYRMTHPGCQECVEKGACIYCGCDTYKKMIDPKSECAGTDENGESFWGPMVSAKQWNEAKNFLGLRFKQEKTKVSKSNNIVKNE